MTGNPIIGVEENNSAEIYRLPLEEAARSHKQKLNNLFKNIRSSQKVQLCFLVDATGSMQSHIDAVKKSIEGIVVNCTVRAMLHVGMASFGIQGAAQNRKPNVRMTLSPPASYAYQGEKYYSLGSQVRILCKVELVAETTNIQILYKYPRGDWNVVSTDDLEVKYETNETLVCWNRSVNQNQEVLCKAEGGDKVNEDKLKIAVADQKPPLRADFKIIRSPAALEGENEKEIYEGDTVVLSCTHPIKDDWRVVWMHNEEEVPPKDVDTTSEGVSRILKTNLSNAVVGSEVYTCVLVNSKLKSPHVLAVNFTVLKTQKPTIVFPFKKAIVELRKGSSATLSCPLTGIPKPKITWYKDGQLFHSEISQENGTLTIHRVTLEDQGVYTCKAINRVGEEEISITTNVEQRSYSLSFSFSFLYLIGLLVAVFVILALLAVCIYYIKKKRNNNPTSADNQIIPLDQRWTEIPYNSLYELEREQLFVEEKEIGSGSFGKVFKGKLTRCDRSYDIAIKRPKDVNDPEHQTMLVQELKIMCALDNHPNVIALLGAVTKSMTNGDFYVVVEFCENGNLKDYIKERKTYFTNELIYLETNEDGTPKKTQYLNERYMISNTPVRSGEKHPLLMDKMSLSTSHLLCFALQIAQGMDFLAKVPCVHRDLALRNVLVNSNGVIRISDFGMARKYQLFQPYYRIQSKNAPLPYRWTSIEAITDGVYTVYSDIWSYGIVLYELFSLAGVPYPNIPDECFIDQLKAGCRNSKPNNCHEEIYQLMTECWDPEIISRPNFNQCIVFMENHLKRCNKPLLQQIEAEKEEQAGEQQRLVQLIRQNDVPQQTQPTPLELPLPKKIKRNNTLLQSFRHLLGVSTNNPANCDPPIVELMPLNSESSQGKFLPNDPHPSNESPAQDEPPLSIPTPMRS